jgi:uncharacterized protein YeeX (DUF496 family)
VVSHEDGATLAREFNISFFETSAMTNVNVDNAFMSIVADIKTRLDAEALENASKNKGKDGKGHKLKDQGKQKQSSWC